EQSAAFARSRDERCGATQLRSTQYDPPQKTVRPSRPDRGAFMVGAAAERDRRRHSCGLNVRKIHSGRPHKCRLAAPRSHRKQPRSRCERFAGSLPCTRPTELNGEYDPPIMIGWYVTKHCTAG